jgi:hypothetical protein
MCPALKGYLAVWRTLFGWDCRLIRRPAKDARRRHEPSSAGLQAKAFGHQKMTFESTLPPVVRKNSIRLPSDRDVGTYLFGLQDVENPESQLGWQKIPLSLTDPVPS